LQANASNPTVNSLTAFYAMYYLMMNLIGLFVSLVGTTPILRIFGLRHSLFIFPICLLVLLSSTLIFPGSWVVVSSLIVIRSLNYSLNHPTREALYIPTTKDIKFKSKAWNDAFGSRIAKSAGALFNKGISFAQPTVAFIASVCVNIGLTSAWIVIVYFLGKKLQDALDNGLVIGQEQKQDS
jgi:ATP:ADP antiporter, AAA family